MIRAALCLGCLLCLLSCGSNSTLRISVVPSAGVRLDTSAAYNGGISPVVMQAGEGSILTVGQEMDGLLHLVRFDSSLAQEWKLDLELGENNWMESSGLHIQDGVLVIPVLNLYEQGVAEYKAQTVNIASGALMAPLTLLRINQNDVGELPGRFAFDVDYVGRGSVHAIWTPDSTKILLFKQYSAGNGRITIEMMLYKRGFSLITKNTVDFRLDTNTQQFVGILADNDGVAYIFLHNDLDSTIEVGRFEILGSKKLRTLKAKLRAKSIGAIAVAPRGHAYVSTYSMGDEPTLSLIDLDFYQERAIVKETPVAQAVLDRRQEPPQIFVLPGVDRVVLSLDQFGEHSKVTNWLIAYDLEGNEAFQVKSEKPMILFGRHGQPAKHQLIGKSLSYLSSQDHTISLTEVELANGKTRVQYIGQIDRNGFPILPSAVIDKRLYLYHDRLYRFTLP